MQNQKLLAHLKLHPCAGELWTLGLFSHEALGNGTRDALDAGRPCEEGRESGREALGTREHHQQDSG